MQAGYDEYAAAHSKLRAWFYVTTKSSGKVAAGDPISKVFAGIDDDEMEEELVHGKDLLIDKKYGIVWNDVNAIKRNLSKIKQYGTWDAQTGVQKL